MKKEENNYDLGKYFKTIGKSLDNMTICIKYFLRGKDLCYMRKNWEELPHLNSKAFLNKAEEERALWINIYTLAKETVSEIERLSEIHNINLKEKFFLTREEIEKEHEIAKESREGFFENRDNNLEKPKPLPSRSGKGGIQLKNIY